MLNIPEAVKQLFKSGESQNYSMSINVGTTKYFTNTLYTIPEENIKGESAELRETLFSGNNPKFGTIQTSQFTISLLNFNLLLKGKYIRVFLHYGPALNIIPYGEFYVESVEKAPYSSETKLICYDYSYFLNVQAANKIRRIPTTTANTAISMCEAIFDKLHLQYTPFTSSTTYNYVTKIPDNTTYGNMLEWMGELYGGWWKPDRYGVFRFVQIGSSASPESIDTFRPKAGEHETSQIPDFTGIIFNSLLRLEETKEQDYLYGSDDGLVYTMDKSNPYIVNYNESQLDALGRTLLPIYNSLKYIPNKIKIDGRPYLECGDWYTYLTDDDTEDQLQITAPVIQSVISGIGALNQTLQAVGQSQTTGELDGTEYNQSSERTAIKDTQTIVSIDSGGKEVYTSTADPSITDGGNDNIWFKYTLQAGLRFDNGATYPDWHYMGCFRGEYTGYGEGWCYIWANNYPIPQDVNTGEGYVFPFQWYDENRRVHLGIRCHKDRYEQIVDTAAVTFYVISKKYPLGQYFTGEWMYCDMDANYQRYLGIKAASASGILWGVALLLFPSEIDVTRPYVAIDGVSTLTNIAKRTNAEWVKINGEWILVSEDIGSEVVVTPTLTEGTEIGTIEVSGKPKKLYAPTSQNEVYYGTSLPTTDIGQDSSLYYKIIQRPEDLKTLNVVEYIQSNRASYIPTDILVTNNTRIMMQGIFYQGDWVGATRAFGIYQTGNSYSRIVAGTAGGYNRKVAFFYFGDDTSAREIPSVHETDAMIMVDVATRTLTISGGGESHSITIPSTVIFTPPNIPLGILCENISSEAGGFEIHPDWRFMNENAIIKRFQVYYNNILAYDLIPVQNANDVTDCGLYDRIHRKYYQGKNYNNYVPFTAGTATGEVINQLDECVEAGYLRVNDEWWEIYNGGTEYFAGNYIEITENNVITSTLKAGTNIQIADDGTISASGAEIVQTVTSGTQLATINGTSIYAPTTTVTQTLTEGTEIGEVNGTKLYAPSGGSDVVVTPKTSTGTNIADIEVDGTTYQLFAPSGGGGEAIETAFIYSNEERVVGVWTDNKPLYQKTYTYSFTASSNDHNYDIVTLSSEVKPQYIETDVFYRDGILFKEVIYPPGNIFYRYAINDNVLSVRVLNSSGSTIEGTVTVRYTKSTDTPGSAPYVTSGAYAHHYSTTEQVVGTWIDGSTLYEKTVVLSNAISVLSGSGSWTTLMSYADFGVDNLYNPIGITCYQSYFAVWGCFSVQAYDGNIYVQQNRGNAVTIDKFTLQYTKTS